LGHNVLWENDATGRFTDVARERGFHAMPTGNYLLSGTGMGRDPEPGKGPGEWVGGNGFGLQCEDVDNDGYLDVFQTNISHPNPGDYGRTWSDPTVLLINGGPAAGYAFENRFLDRGLPFNEGDVDGAMVDFDNDGRMDLSMSRDKKYEGAYSAIDQKSWFGLMHQLADGTFESVGYTSGINDPGDDPFNKMKMAQNHAWSDFDHDGDLDLLVGGRDTSGAGRPNFLFENRIGSENDWLIVWLVGDGERVNRDAIGARVVLRYGERLLMREVKSSRGMYNSMDMRSLHFGLGDLPCGFSMEVRWPDGTVERIDDVDGALGRKAWVLWEYGRPPERMRHPDEPTEEPTSEPTGEPTDEPTEEPTRTSLPTVPPVPPSIIYLPRSLRGAP